MAFILFMYKMCSENGNKKKKWKNDSPFFAVIKKKIIPNEENLASFNEELLINYVTLFLSIWFHLNWNV